MAIMYISTAQFIGVDEEGWDVWKWTCNHCKGVNQQKLKGCTPGASSCGHCPKGVILSPRYTND